MNRHEKTKTERTQMEKMMLSQISRRSFIRSATAAGVAASMTGSLRGQDKAVSAAEKINVGVIGCGGMGNANMNEVKGQKDVNIVGLADVDTKHLAQTIANAKEAGHNPTGYADYRKLLERNDLDGVIIATPDHWHAIPAIHAAQAEKDIYCQKPLTHNLHEGRVMVQAARKHKRVTQMGNQIHATENYHRVAEIIQSGVLGDIGLIRVWMAENRGPGGRGTAPEAQPPAELDYDAWLGPAPKKPYTKLRSHFHWRYFWDFGGGHFLDFVCHLHDLVHWGMQVNAPLTATASGSKYHVKDDSDTPNTLIAAFEYPNFMVEWSMTGTNAHGLEGRGSGVMFHGTKAALHCHYGDFVIIPENKDEPIVLPEPTLPRSPGQERQWLDHIKTRELCDCDFEYGHRLTSVGHLGNIAYRTGEKLQWDAAAERITNHKAANALLTREYRSPYTLPKV
jgi:predicted dehydrogenase